MIRQTFYVEHYWKVIVFYSVDYDFFHEIHSSLQKTGANGPTIRKIYQNMHGGNAKAVTYSNLHRHVSIVLFNFHKSKADYLNSIVHEAEHIKQAMLDAYDVEDKGEPPAYTIGYLVMEMYKIFRKLL